MDDKKKPKKSAVVALALLAGSTVAAIPAVISPMIVIASTASMMSAGPLIGISGLGIPVAIGLAGFYSFRWLRNQ